MAGLSVSNLLLAIGVGFDSQLKAADNLFFSTAIEIDDPAKPMFGGPIGNTSGVALTLGDSEAQGYMLVGEGSGVDGSPVAIKQIATADGPRYVITDGTGKEIMIQDPSAGGNNARLQSTPRYVVKSDGIIYDCLVHSNPAGDGLWRVANPAAPFGGQGIVGADLPAGFGIQHYARPVAKITFKAKEGATLARSQDELGRISSSVQLLVRLLESVQDESRSFTSIIR